jgi:hypothetical protein
MTVKFIPDGQLNIDTDPLSLPVAVSGKNEVSSALTICKNLSLDNQGLAKTRNGSTKINSTAIADTEAYAIVESEGDRYLFTGDKIYRNETEIIRGLTSANWHGFLYKIRNKDVNSIFATNGTDRKRITGSTVEEWGIDAPESAPILSGTDYSITYDWEADNLPENSTYRKFTNTTTTDTLLIQEKTTILSKRWVSGGAASMAYSDNAIAWTELGNPLVNTTQYALCWNGSIWVAGGGTANTLGYSHDGIVWFGLGAGTISSSVRAIEWDGSKFIAMGIGAAHNWATSVDGKTWVGRGAGPFIIGYGLAYDGSRWVATGWGTSDTIAYTDDGITWNGLGNSIFSNTGDGVAWNGSVFVAVGAGTTNTIATSTDGITWTGRGKTIFDVNGYGVAWNGSVFVAVGAGTTNTIATSTDGITWTGLGTGVFATYGRSVAWNGTRFVAVGRGTNERAYSSDGTTWTVATAGSGHKRAVRSAPAPELIPSRDGVPSVATGTTLVDAEIEYIYAWEEYYKNIDDVIDYVDVNTLSFYSTYFYETAVSAKDIKVKYTYVRKVSGILEAESNPSDKATTDEVVYNGIGVTWAATSDPQVTHVRLYRTLPSSFDYFFDSEHDVGLLSASLTKTDTALGTEAATNHNRPPLGNVVYGPAFNGYCFMLLDNKLHYCLPFQPEYWPLEYYIEVGPPQLDLRAIVFFNGATYVMNRNEMFLIQGSSADTFFPYPLGGVEAGAINQNTVEAVKGAGIFRVHNDGVWLFNGSIDKKITEERFAPMFNGETKGTIPAINKELIENSWLFYYKTKLYFGYPAETSTYPDNLLVFNIQTNKFSHYDYSQTFRAITADKTNDRILAADNAGFVWELENYKLTEDNGTAISWEIQSKSFSDALYKYFPRFAKYDIELGQGASAVGDILLNNQTVQSHVISNRKTKKRHIDGSTGDRLEINISGTGVASIRQVEVE